VHRQVPKRGRLDATGIERKMKVKSTMKSIKSLNYSVACTTSQEITMEAYSNVHTHSVVFFAEQNIADSADNR
jgi:hypothetical protein